jgi:hypothetical protein
VRIDFLHPTHHKGLNSTVRRGVRNIKPGDTVELYETGAEEPVCFGVVEAVHTLYMANVTDAMLSNQHDEETRTMAGLEQALDRAYGGVAPDELVTIIEYWVNGGLT